MNLLRGLLAAARLAGQDTIVVLVLDLEAETAKVTHHQEPWT